MVKFEFYLSYDDADRLFDLKEAVGEDDLTANEFAEKLLKEAMDELEIKLNAKEYSR